MLFVVGVVHLLVQAFGIEVEHAGVGAVELGIHYFSDILTSFRVVSQSASSSDLQILILSVVSVMVEILVLIDAHVDIISGFPAFSRVSASIVDHNSFQINFNMGLRHLISLDNLVCKVGNVNSCIALSSYVKLIVPEGGEFLIEFDKSFVVVLCSCSIVTFYSPFGLTKTDSSWG